MAIQRGFGEFNAALGYRTLNERAMRASGGIMLLLGIIAFINAFILGKYIIVTYVSGFLLLNFALALFIGSRYSPTLFLGTFIVRKQAPLPIGAIQKHFAWSLGLTLATTIFVLSLFLLNNPAFFQPVCLLCVICLSIIYLETAFGICVGCKLYYLALDLKLIARPAIDPNCMGDACDIR